MYCKKCGEPLRDGYAYCGSCGTPTHAVLPTPGGYIDRPATGVPIYNYAGFWRRFAALLLDGVIAAVLAIIPLVVLALLGYVVANAVQADAVTSLQQQRRDDNNETWATVGGVLAATITFYAYHIVATWHGGGWGKRAMGIRVVREDLGTKPGAKAWLRVLFPVVLGIVPIAGSLLQLVDHVSMLWDEDKQTWHDKVAGTVVIKHAWRASERAANVAAP